MSGRKFRKMLMNWDLLVCDTVLGILVLVTFSGTDCDGTGVSDRPKCPVCRNLTGQRTAHWNIENSILSDLWDHSHRLCLDDGQSYIWGIPGGT